MLLRIIIALVALIGTASAQKVRCGKELINPQEQVCCNGFPHVKAWGNETSCCDQYAYNPRIENCCNGWVEQGFGFENEFGECCGQRSYDKRCYKCDRKTKFIVPTFDHRSHICCDGEIKLLLPDKTCCCGTKPFDPTNKYCCEGVIKDRPDDVPEDCCSSKPFELTNKYCCGRKPFDPTNKYCCGTKPFDPTNKYCCGTKPFDPTNKYCCGTKPFDPTNKYCCSTKPFNPTIKYCCEGVIKDRPDDVPGDCCNCGLTLVDIVLVLDSSESINDQMPAPGEPTNWEKMKQFTVDILAEADINKDRVRVGMVTYNHDVKAEFHLDSYHDKTEMFRHVLGAKYTPGATNTGGALSFTRVNLFDHRRGDRPNVPDVLVLITDGKSQNFDDTVDQARLVREQGIHIFAIGIGLSNLTELNNIASPPANKNVLNIANFEDLQTLQGQVFASICTGTPVIKRYEPCGDDWYLPDQEICCYGKPQPLVNGKKTKCCGQKSYDDQKEMCCENVINDRPSKKYVCCGKRSYDPDRSLCCDFKPVFRANKNVTKCCDIYAYNPKEEVCCDGFVMPGYGDIDKDTGCCEEFSYDKRCYECFNGRLKPLFDPECQVCCDGVIHNMTLGLSCCCGEDIFKPEEWICCNNKLRKREESEKENICCECRNALVDIGIVLDSSESISDSDWVLLKKFLIDLVSSSDINTGDTRFGLVTYRHDVTLEFYLKQYLRKANMVQHLREMEQEKGATNTGLGIETMRNSLFVNRNGDRKNVEDIGLVITDGHSSDKDYTRRQAMLAKAEGIHIYVIGVGLNVTQELKDIASEPWEDNVFTSKSFEDLSDLESQIFSAIGQNCPQEPKKKLRKPCGKKMYDPRSQVCCDGNPQDKFGSDENTRCCGKMSYSVRDEMCCKGKLSRRPHPTRSLCCEEEGYDPRDAICCYNTTVIPKVDKGATDCCGLETYDPKKELCCDDQLFRNYGPNGCCGACCLLKDGTLVSYDTRCYMCEMGELVPLYDCAYQRCCDGVVQNITSDESCCCGKKAFDPADQICCNNKLKPRTEDDDPQCCECAKNLIDIAFVLDSSESVDLVNWVLMEEFVEDLINSSSLPETRFGLVTYRHNVSLVFYLNQYSLKEDLMRVVDNLPYIPGSTNTGEAIEVTRKFIFSRQNGDRPSAPNFMIVITDGKSTDPTYTLQQAELAKRAIITDGKSTDPTYTLQQAELAKRANIHILAIGVGLDEVGEAELKAIASEPPAENAISIQNFTELEKKKDKIFSEMSESICPQYPETRCKVPCGDDFIDETMEVCCYENPQPKVADNRTLCCDTVAFDPDCFICCEGYLVSRYAGSFTDCCCRVAYDTRTHVCCGNQILPKVGRGDVTGCCHNTSYDTRTEVCCGLMLHVQPSYGVNKTACCGDKSYDMLCNECENNKKIVPRYDETTHVCCEGDIQKREFEDRSCCCGKKQFDVDKGICCDGKLITRPKRGEVVCCGKSAYDPKTKICCDNMVQPRVNGYDTLCCGKTSFNPDEQYCCEKNLNNRTSLNENCCCDETVFDVNKHVCCEGSVYPLVLEGVRASSICCGNVAFDPNTHLCCDRKVRPLIEDANTVCCGDKAYDSKTHVCEYGKVVQALGRCQGRIYNMDQEICCNGWINGKIKGAGNTTRCCHDKAYDTRKHVCCCNGHLQPAFAGENTQCCYAFGYDAKSHICCDGQVVEKRVPSADCCCDRESYDSQREICCGGKVKSRVYVVWCKKHTQCCYAFGYDAKSNICCDGQVVEKRVPSADCCCDRESYDSQREICCGGKVKSRCVGLFTKCCGTEAYDPGYMICCNGKLYNRSYGHDTYCCGDEIYTPLLAACCGDKIAYRRKLKIEW